MSIDQSKVIDAIGIDKKTKAVILTISDHLDWSSPESHMQKLQDKLNSYLEFCESGQIYDQYPEASKGQEIIFSIIAKYDLPKEGLDFMENARSIIDEAGFSLVFKKLPRTNWLASLFNK